MNTLAISLVSLALMAGAGDSNSAYIGTAKHSNGRGLAGVMIEGEIALGDFAKFEKVLLQRGNNIDPVWLASPGGDLAEAMKIGRLIRELKLTVWAPFRSRLLFPTLASPSNAVCASACFFLYAGRRLSNRGGSRSAQALLHHKHL